MAFRLCLIRWQPLSATQKLILSSIIVYVIISFTLCCFFEEAWQHGSSIGYFSAPYQEMVPSRAAKDNVLRIFHTEDSLCLDKPNDLSIPVDSFDVAIMFHNGGCSAEKKALNIAEWYRKENPKVKMALIYNWRKKTKRSRKKEDVVDTVGKSFKSIIVRGEDQTNLPTSLQLHYITEEYSTKIIDMITNSSYQIDDGPNNYNNSGPATHSVYANFSHETKMYYESVCAKVFLISTISLIMTVAFQIVFWKGFFSIEFTSEGIIVYSTDSGNVDSAEVKPPKLMTEDQVHDLFPEIGYGAEGSINLKNKCGTAAKSEAQCKFRSSSDQSSCSICLDDFVKGDRLRVLHCGHMYHTDCIMPWLTKQRSNCPMCKESFEDLETGRKER